MCHTLNLTVTEYEEHSKTAGDVEAYTGSGQHKTSKEEKKSDATRKAPPNQLTIPKAREQYRQHGRWRHLSDSSVASYQSINENQGILTPDPYGACHEDTRVTPHYRGSRRVYSQQTPSREQYSR